MKRIRIELDDTDAATLDTLATEYDITLPRLAAKALELIAEGVRRPGAWEADAARPLLNSLDFEKDLEREGG